MRASCRRASSPRSCSSAWNSAIRSPRSSSRFACRPMRCASCTTRGSSAYGLVRFSAPSPHCRCDAPSKTSSAVSRASSSPACSPRYRRSSRHGSASRAHSASTSFPTTRTRLRPASSSTEISPSWEGSSCRGRRPSRRSRGALARASTVSPHTGSTFSGCGGRCSYLRRGRRRTERSRVGEDTLSRHGAPLRPMTGTSRNSRRQAPQRGVRRGVRGQPDAGGIRGGAAEAGDRRGAMPARFEQLAAVLPRSPGAPKGRLRRDGDKRRHFEMADGRRARYTRAC